MLSGVLLLGNEMNLLSHCQDWEMLIFLPQFLDSTLLCTREKKPNNISMAKENGNTC
jgi:hypothetical protein